MKTGFMLNKWFKYSWLLAGLWFSAGLVFADEPPSWTDYSRSNGEFYFEVAREAADTAVDYADANWNLAVYHAKDSSLVWKTPYNYDGYPEGRLTADGRMFYVVREWYYPDRPIILAYLDGKPARMVRGRELGIPNGKLVETVSHKLWLAREAPVDLEVREPGEYIIKVNSIDGGKHQFLISAKAMAKKEAGEEEDEHYQWQQQGRIPWTIVGPLVGLLIYMIWKRGMKIKKEGKKKKSEQ